MTDWKKIVAKCEEAGWTRRTLANELGIAYTTLCDIANGHTTEPKGMVAVELYRIANEKQKAAA